MKIILESKSPRRKELLHQLGYTFTVAYVETDELITDTTPTNAVLAIARQKADLIFEQFPDDLVICADTIVVVNRTILGKPQSIDEAYQMIDLLQNNQHQVYTAIVCKCNQYEKTAVEKTDVYVKPMTKEEIMTYIQTDEPYDKAGGYGIQGLFAQYIDRIEGDYYNVMGLPIHILKPMIEALLDHPCHN